ncbi:hypothetical protein FB382_003791 [Nocardioides ginsengisegetis]|uniref:Excalibur calcium-binding domain-containing protein n=1 Tax=Nocardioides ginsengisegetis TaxID=661491 RepID=A0A7W3PB60_9ACTN|nr:hypothetical protein [Nocardioides ginsengisegetis]
MLTSIPPTLRRYVAALATAGLLAVLTGCAPVVHATAPGKPDRPKRPEAGTALALLATLPVKGRAPMTGYDRDRFGPAWLDVNRNGCDERNDILARDLTGTREQNCRILDGTLIDPYTARTIHYVYGDGALVDIDHVVALGNAWATGASRWSVLKRAGLATDPLNLLAVDASANRQKGDGDAATWLPPNKAYRCAYVARQVAVKAKFGLWVTAPERSAIQRVLSRCPDQPVPADSGAPVEVTHHITDPGDGDGDGSYASCDAARAAGAAPLHRGDPGYGPQLDGDGDGIACE